MKKIFASITILCAALLIYENYYQYQAAENFGYLKINTLQLERMLGSSDKSQQQKRYETEKWYVGSNVAGFESACSMSISNSCANALIIMPKLRAITAWPQILNDVPQEYVNDLQDIRKQLEVVGLNYSLVNTFNILLGLIASVTGIIGFFKE